ncbi:dynobactin A family peptide antibiotic [Xenorhabdus griffiniae]|uniref:dynobactin A family peptide antibiotic n=1 Tax=Xenorhabdus griffiniae TaxID=351672 RepID=UPI0030D5A46B
MKDLKKSNLWNKELLDCVGGAGKDVGQSVEPKQVNKLVKRAASPDWDGNIYKYSF